MWPNTTAQSTTWKVVTDCLGSKYTRIRLSTRGRNMAIILNYSPSSAPPKKNFGTSPSSSSLWLKRSINRNRSVPFGNYRYKNKKGVKAFFFNPTDEPILKEALKEPVAFMGGMFAGLLRLDLNEDPLKEWVTRTVEASGITEEEIDAEGSKPEEEIPQQIEIE